MERKARENLAAARTLLQAEEPCPNAAASRAYHAAYQACWAAMAERGEGPPEVRPGIKYFLHDRLPREAFQAGVLGEREGKVLAELRDLRVEADYFEHDELTVEMVRKALEDADALVQRLLGEEAEYE